MIAAGAKLAERCNSCHGAEGNTARSDVVPRLAGCHGYDGNSLNPYMPNLAGQSMEYLIKATKDYRDGRRKDGLMQEPVSHLNDKTIANIAAYYAHQRPETPLSEGPADSGIFDPLADGAKIAASCEHCHGERGFSTHPGNPRLAGQSEAYLVVAMQEYQDGTRTSQTMHAIADVSSLLEIKAVAAYYARQTTDGEENAAP